MFMLLSFLTYSLKLNKLQIVYNMNDYHITYELNTYTDKPAIMERTYSRRLDRARESELK